MDSDLKNILEMLMNVDNSVKFYGTDKDIITINLTRNFVDKYKDYLSPYCNNAPLGNPISYKILGFKVNIVSDKRI